MLFICFSVHCILSISHSCSYVLWTCFFTSMSWNNTNLAFIIIIRWCSWSWASSDPPSAFYPLLLSVAVRWACDICINLYWQARRAWGAWTGQQTMATHIIICKYIYPDDVAQHFSIIIKRVHLINKAGGKFDTSEEFRSRGNFTKYEVGRKLFFKCAV